VLPARGGPLAPHPPAKRVQPTNRDTPSLVTFRSVIGFELGKETPARQAPAKTCLLPNGLDPYACVIERKINLVTRCDPQTVAHRFRNHHLPLGANTGGHTGEYNFLRASSTAPANGMQLRGLNV